ncbi:GH92 family glycosyl hydrolase [Aeoliella sp. ICT_H6.2]|uniref:GH92 family glycosyl hydrolase n=1 Tax=Aeoliella straminimaris TaxID=2954799 RepID=A0A9X2F7T6_9BACT|nr:GH92 family glycosyl hydrolase [Aeoliella straminimaris]MCO6043223.1 GH92 family glycosyl hydrolase [Aeoliella straminimaris]
MKPHSSLFVVALACLSLSATKADEKLVDHVNPFLGTAPLTDEATIGYDPPWRVWAGLTFPGASLPNAMVQLSPITEFGSGAGYEYEDDKILAFTHTNKGHWNLCHIPLLPVTGEVDADDFASAYSHEHESASPGYYQVKLARYDINAELTTTLRCGLHRYSFPAGTEKKLVADLARSNERVRDSLIERDGDSAFRGFQRAGEKVYFYARANHKIASIDTVQGREHSVRVLTFEPSRKPLEIRIGLSFVSVDNAKENLETELASQSFARVKRKASDTWEQQLSKIRVTGGTDRQVELFYSCLYRCFLWPALRSDVNGQFTDDRGNVVNKGFRYYTLPSLWDTYRNKLVLLGLLSPDVAADVIQSMVDRGEISGFLPTFFHGDHAAPFITGMYLRGIRNFDVQAAYKLMLRSATEENRRARPYLTEYMRNGYISTRRTRHPHVETRAKAGVTKTLEYAYDDYAVALLARELGDEETYHTMMERSKNYANLFDESTGLMRGRLRSGEWVEPFDAQQPYYEYMYREANAWQSSFFAPHDTEGLVALYPSHEAFEKQLDQLFSLPWNPQHIARNVSSFIGQYCHGNQPDHGYAYLYYWIGKPEKSQKLLNTIMDRFYGMEGGNTLCGMDDTGEMSAWYVFNAIGLYPYSPADPAYIVTVPIFDEVKLRLGDTTVEIVKRGFGTRIERIRYGMRTIDGYFVPHADLASGQTLSIETRPAD